MKAFIRWARPGRWKYQWRYLRGQTPWDTNITPPEVMEFIQTAPAGKALDIGCGTGTNAITLAQHGWDVIGVDFAANAVRSARRKAAAAGFNITFHTADVTDLDFIKGRFDYLLDIGCLFTLDPQDRSVYAKTLARLTKPGGFYMLYAWQPHLRNGVQRGISPADVDTLLNESFAKKHVVTGEEKAKPSAWYWYRRR